MGERNWTDELEQYLRDKFAELCTATGQPVPHSGLRINPALGIEESKYFLSGLEAGLFQLDDEGNVRSALLPAEGEDNIGRMCPIFRHYPPPPRFFRESVCQLSTASSLILKRGWLRSHVFIEPNIDEYRTLPGGADILIRSTTGDLLVCVEVKRSVAELEKLMTDFRTCCHRGAHAREDCGFPQNHPTYEFCALYRPVYFWGVAPDADVCLRMRYDGDSIEMEQLPSLPPRSMMEFK